MAVKLTFYTLFTTCLAFALSVAGQTTNGPVQMFVPGFVVRELPLELSNQNNVEYAPDGRLFAAGYDGRIHLLRDTDGDGLEDSITTFGEQTGGDYPLGLVVRGDSVYVMFRGEVARFRDTNGDGVPDKRETALQNWDDPETAKQDMFIKRRVDFAMGLAIAPDGTYYITMGNAAFNKAYLLDKEGNSQYSPKYRRGCVLKISPDGSKVEQIATGVRYIMSLQFNRHGDLLASEQEGATWLPNGNPFDELLHIQPGRHYGFPPRHPKYLPDVIDEPSVFDYGPEHQSICGFRLNESGPGRARFGPPSWEGDALLTGEARGKLYRTKLVKTPAGYVAQNHLIAALPNLAVDCTLSPKGDLLIATHTGKPDWGTGPKGIGRIFKISYAANATPAPLFAYSASPTETRVEFDRPLDATQWKNVAKQSGIESGRYVGAGDRFETFRPGYAVVQMQQKEPRQSRAVLTASLSADGRALSLQTAPRVEAVNYALAAVTVPIIKNGMSQIIALDLAHDLTGVSAAWQPKDTKTAPWSGWLPHVDLRVTRELAAASADHAKLFAQWKQAGSLRLRGQFDLSLMLRSSTQPLGKLEYEYPPETVTLVLTGNTPLRLTAAGAKVKQVNARTVHLTLATTRTNAWVPFDLSLETQKGGEPSLDAHWFTAEDSRPRALALRRTLVPWARPIGAAPESRAVPELAGGNWEAGKKLYFSEQVACAKCHVMRGEGGNVGPDLSNLVHRDYASVLKDITQPSAALNPDHLAYTIDLKDGESVTAVIAGDTGSELLLADVTGKTTRVPRSKITTTRPSAISLMPEGLLQTLKPNQVRDLMTFLLTDGK
jgi:putative heme-binding domain-containing protein